MESFTGYVESLDIEVVGFRKRVAAVIHLSGEGDWRGSIRSRGDIDKWAAALLEISPWNNLGWMVGKPMTIWVDPQGSEEWVVRLVDVYGYHIPAGHPEIELDFELCE